MIAGGFGFFPPGVIVWSMLATNLLALAIGAVLAARLAIHLGSSPWPGLAVPLNIGLLYEIWIGGAGVLAYMFGLGALCALAIDRGWTAAFLLAAAALAREGMVAFALGVLVLMWLDEHRFLWRLLITPLFALVVWHAYIRYRLLGVNGSGANWPIFAPPFFGMVEAFQSWTEDPSELLASATLIVIVTAFIPLVLRSHLPIAWGALPFAALATILSVQVWREPSDLARALAPVITAAPFLILIPRGQPMSESMEHSMREPA